MTVSVQAALNTPPPAPLRTLAPPWGTAGALRALLSPSWAGAPCPPQGPHVQLARGRGCHDPGVRGEAGRQQGGDEQEDRDDRADHRRSRHSRHYHFGPLLDPTFHLRLHHPAPGITGNCTGRSRETRPWWRPEEHWQRQQRPGRTRGQERGPQGGKMGERNRMSSPNGLRAKTCSSLKWGRTERAF